MDKDPPMISLAKIDNPNTLILKKGFDSRN